MLHLIRTLSLGLLLCAPQWTSFAEEDVGLPQAEIELRKLAQELPLIESSDTKLKRAYAALFLQRYGKPVWRDTVANDLKRRGEKVMPLLLELFDDNPEGAFREEFLLSIKDFPSIETSPILSKVREWAKDETSVLPRRSWSAVCSFLSNFGTSEDFPLFESLIAREPQGEIAWMATRHLQTLKKRLESESSKVRKNKDVRQTNFDSGTSRPKVAKPADTSVMAQHSSELPSSSSPSSIIVVLIAATIGLLWLLFKGRK